MKVRRVTAAYQWYLCKAVWLCSTESAQNPHLWIAAVGCRHHYGSAIWNTLDVISTFALLSHLPLRLTPRRSKGKAGHTPYLKHSSVVHTATGATRANPFLCASGTGLGCHQQQPPPNLICMHKSKSMWTGQGSVNFWSKINYQYCRCKQGGKFSIKNYINFPLYHSAYFCRDQTLYRLHRPNKLLVPCKQWRSQMPGRNRNQQHFKLW